MKKILLLLLVLSSCDITEPVVQYYDPIITKQIIDTPQSHGPDSLPTSQNAYVLAFLYKKDFTTHIQYRMEIYTHSLLGGGGGLFFQVHWTKQFTEGYVDLYDGRYFFEYDEKAVDYFSWVGYSREGYYFD